MSTMLEWATAWNSKLLPGNSGNNILFIKIINRCYTIIIIKMQIPSKVLSIGGKKYAVDFGPVVSSKLE